MEKFNIFVTLFIVTINVMQCLSECTMTVENVDECTVKGMVFGNRQVVIPSNDQELDRHCGNLREGVQCAKDYVSTCLNGFVQKMLLKGLKNSNNHVDRLCNDTERRASFLENTRCFNPSSKLEPVHVCSDRYLSMVERLRNVGFADRIPASCCVFFYYKECIEHAVTDICGADNWAYWENIINEMLEDSPAMNCNTYNTIEKCNKSLRAPILEPLRVIATSNNPADYSNHKFSSPVALTLDLLKDLKM